MSGNDSRDGAAVRFPPPFVPLIALVVGFAISWLAGPLPNPVVGAARFVAGGVLLAAGLGFMLLAMGLFRETGQDPAPWAKQARTDHRYRDRVARGVGWSTCDTNDSPRKPDRRANARRGRKPNRLTLFRCAG